MAIENLMTIVDSHTGGEPTRTIIAGGPDLGEGTMAERLEVFREKYDYYRSSLVNEPRGSDVMVGALLCEPIDSTNAAGVIFFNNVGYLGMCGHGTIGLAVTLYYLGKIELGVHTFETPVGDVTVNLVSPNKATIQNVASYRHAKDVAVNVDGIGEVRGDVAWGGNWFFLIQNHGQQMSISNTQALTLYCDKVRDALWAQGITGKDGQMIDHIELFGPPTSAEVADSQSFVLCPGSAYDRSPCGTGTSAKLACLVADGKLEAGQVWRQQSIIGSVFEGEVLLQGGQMIPTITGEAFVNLKAEVICDPGDHFRFGIGASH